MEGSNAYEKCGIPCLWKRFFYMYTDCDLFCIHDTKSLFFAKQELLPFLTDGVDDEEDVLAAIATSLGKLIPYVGGSEHIHSLLPPMELLLSVGEKNICDVYFS